MKAIRLHIKQNTANYRREETVNCRMTYPLPPYSTVIGALHKACGYTEYRPMKLSIQGSYGSLKRRLFKEDIFLNSLQNDRGILVKMKNPDMLCSAYEVVATALKAQGNDFDKGITINVANQKLIEEYRFLNRRKKHFDKLKKNVVDKYSAKLKTMKEDKEIPEAEVKAFAKRVKNIKNAYKALVTQKYDIPRSRFKTLTKAPKYYELLCDVELIIHIQSDEKTMQDIVDNIFNLTAIGRSEDFVEVLDCREVDLQQVSKDGAINEDIHIYMPIEYIDDDVLLFQNEEQLPLYGTKYLLNKDYTVVDDKRIFNKIPVLYTNGIAADEGCKNAAVDIIDNKEYLVFMV